MKYNHSIRLLIAFGCLAISLPAAYAQGDAASASQLASVKLPTGATRAGDATLSEGLGHMLSDFATERKLTPGTAGTEVLVWAGKAYKPGRAKVAQSAFERTLTEAGYKVQTLGREEVYASVFKEPDLTQEEGFLKPSAWDTTTFIVATNAQKQQTLVGTWMDQGNQNRLVLALASAGFVAPKTQVLPAVTGANALLVKDIHDVMKGVKTPTPAFPTLSRVPGHVRGFVKDGSGKPLANAKIIVESSAVGGFGTSTSGRTNVQGLYDIPVPFGAARVIMSGYSVSYNGKTYALPLHPVDGECEHFTSSKGHVEHLVLRSYGVANPAKAEEDPGYGGNYYGGSVRVKWLVDDIAPGGVVEVTLKPQGRLLDGSQGKTLVFRLPNQQGGDMNLNDIPIGRYALSAHLLEDGDNAPIKVKKVWGSGEWGQNLTVDFEPRSREQVFSNTGGIERFDVVLSL